MIIFLCDEHNCERPAGHAGYHTVCDRPDWVWVWIGTPSKHVSQWQAVWDGEDWAMTCD